MKVVTGIGVLQLLVTGFLLFKVVSLEAGLFELKPKLGTKAQQGSSASTHHWPQSFTDSASAQTLSIDDIRRVVRSELAGALSRDEILTEIKSKAQESDPELIREFESRIEYYLSDGAFSREDLLDMEDKIVKLAPADRRKMMNKLTKAMSKANIQLIE